jgi:hypothetical protein
MRTASTLSPGRARVSLTGRAVIAGIVGGIMIDLFLVVIRAASFPGMYASIAEAAVGRAAYSWQSYIALGIGLHFAISIVAALAYAYLGSALHLLRRWLVGGTLLGVVLMVVMHGVQHLVGRHPPLTAAALLTGLIAHVVFFGWPVAYIERPE